MLKGQPIHHDEPAAVDGSPLDGAAIGGVEANAVASVVVLTLLVLAAAKARAALISSSTLYTSGMMTWPTSVGRDGNGQSVRLRHTLNTHKHSTHHRHHPTNK